MGETAAQQPSTSAATPPGDPGTVDSRSADPLKADPLKAERRKNNQLEKEIRTLRQQLNRFSEINPEEYSRLQEAERQKQVLKRRMELRERQMEEASAQRVAAVAAERDDARGQVLQLRKDHLLERAFSQPSPRPRAAMAMTPSGRFLTSSRGSWAELLPLRHWRRWQGRARTGRWPGQTPARR